MKGKVRWFNNRKGYGFIGREDGGRDLFVHYTGIEKEGYKTLKPKQTVEFNVVEGPKGDQAGSVTVLKEPEVETTEVETTEEG
jgi:CspA family cold shock protein